MCFPENLLEFSVKVSSVVANRIKPILQHLFDNGCRYVSFDVESLFTNVPVQRTVNIILNQIYNDQLIFTDSKKRILKKLHFICMHKNSFHFQKYNL